MTYAGTFRNRLALAVWIAPLNPIANGNDQIGCPLGLDDRTEGQVFSFWRLWCRRDLAPHRIPAGVRSLRLYGPRLRLAACPYPLRLGSGRAKLGVKKTRFVLQMTIRIRGVSCQNVR